LLASRRFSPNDDCALWADSFDDKSVSALHFNILWPGIVFVGINIEMIAIEGGAANMIAALDRGVEITRTAAFS
jgi:hypothetical protein